VSSVHMCCLVSLERWSYVGQMLSPMWLVTDIGHVTDIGQAIAGVDAGDLATSPVSSTLRISCCY